MGKISSTYPPFIKAVEEARRNGTVLTCWSCDHDWADKSCGTMTRKGFLCGMCSSDNPRLAPEYRISDEDVAEVKDA